MLSVLFRSQLQILGAKCTQCLAMHKSATVKLTNFSFSLSFCFEVLYGRWSRKALTWRASSGRSIELRPLPVCFPRFQGDPWKNLSSSTQTRTNFLSDLKSVCSWSSSRCCSVGKTKPFQWVFCKVRIFGVLGDKKIYKTFSEDWRNCWQLKVRQQEDTELLAC